MASIGNIVKAIKTTLLAALLSASTMAKAVVLMGCPSPMIPPPCIIIDPVKIASTVAEVNQKRQELQQAINTVNELKSIGATLGSLRQPLSSMPTAPQSSIGVKPFTLSQNIEGTARLMMPSGKVSTQAAATARSYVANMSRNAALDGYGLALHSKSKLGQISAEAKAMQQELQAASADQRSDWQLNTKAQMLLFKTIAMKREIETARLTIMGANLNSTARMPTNRPGYTQAPNNKPVSVSPTGIQLTNLATAKQEVDNLQKAVAASKTIVDVQALMGQTIGEYNATVQMAQNADAQLRQAMLRTAQNHSSRTGNRMSSAAIQNMANNLYNTAISTMQQRDRTTWADANKGQVQQNAGSIAYKTIDSMVSGSPVKDAQQIIINRHDMAKQVSFFSPIAADARASITELNAENAKLGTEFGLPVATPQALQQKLAAAQTKLNAALIPLQSAPADVQGMVKAIMGN